MSSLFGQQKTGEEVAELILALPDGGPCLARLESCDVTGRDSQFESTRDPRWITSCAGVPQEWLCYKAPDGRCWWVRVRAQYNSATRKIDLAFEHRGPAAAAGQTPEQLSRHSEPAWLHRIDFIGADNHSHYVAVLHSASLCQTPKFQVRPVA